MQNPGLEKHEKKPAHEMTSFKELQTNPVFTEENSYKKICFYWHLFQHV